jgi:hypothetical protein
LNKLHTFRVASELEDVFAEVDIVKAQDHNHVEDYGYQTDEEMFVGKVGEYHRGEDYVYPEEFVMKLPENYHWANREEQNENREYFRDLGNPILINICLLFSTYLYESSLDLTLYEERL